MISIIVPVFNEEECVKPFCREIGQVMNGEKYELIFVNDGSIDNTVKIICNEIKQDPSIKLVSLTRNFGHQAAIMAGLDNAHGDAIITMDVDFQDPPGLIPAMLEKWREGNKVVFARRKLRKDSILKRVTAGTYYWLLHKFSDIKIKGNIGDYRLIDRSIHEYLKGTKEKSGYIRGLISWMGHSFAVVDYDRPKRAFGKSKFNFLKMARFAMEGILNFSFLPLRIGFVLGLAIIPLGVFFLLYMALDAFVFNQYYPLYKWISVVTFTFQGFMFILMWVLAEYIGKIYNRDREKPTYVIAEKKNFA